MISKINIEEFREQLKSNTKIGNPKIKGTPFAIFSIFGDLDKVFFGTFNKTSFELTRNKTLFPTPFIIAGKFNSKSNNQTEIIYEIKPIGFGYYWLKYLPIVGILIFNLTLYTQSETIDVYIFINLILFGFAVCSYIYMWRKKNRLEKVFRKVFKIEIK